LNIIDKALSHCLLLALSLIKIGIQSAEHSEISFHLIMTEANPTEDDMARIGVMFSLLRIYMNLR